MKNRFLFFVNMAIFLLPYIALAQQEKLDTAAFRKIRIAELSDSHIPQLAHLLTDVSGPRLTNSPGFFRAANWAVATMKGWGLKNAALEPWGEYGNGWEANDFSLNMTAPYWEPVISYPAPWSPSTNGLVHAGVILLPVQKMADTSYINKHLADYAGKIILLYNSNSKLPGDSLAFSHRLTDTELMNLPDLNMVDAKRMPFFLKQLKTADVNLSKLKTAGALALISSNGRDGTVTVQSSFSNFRSARPARLPEALISGIDGFKIIRLITSGQRVEMSLNIVGKFNSEDPKGYNVIAEIPGSDKNLKAQLVMLGGHLDSWTAATGATDNGAGCIVMMEAVRLLDSLHLQPKRTIRIALWSGEEEGLLGSYNYVKNHFGDAETAAFKPEQSKVSVYFNLDNGTGKIRGIYTQNNKEVVPMFNEWLTPFHDLGATAVTSSNNGSTDHLSFDWDDIPAFQFIQDPLDYETKTHHTNMDTYDYLRIDDLKQAAIIVASFVYQAANRPEMIQRKSPVKEKFLFDGF